MIANFFIFYQSTFNGIYDFVVSELIIGYHVFNGQTLAKDIFNNNQLIEIPVKWMVLGTIDNVNLLSIDSITCYDHYDLLDDNTNKIVVKDIWIKGNKPLVKLNSNYKVECKINLNKDNNKHFECDCCNSFKINPFKINPFKINPFKINPFKIKIN